jgi:hypothetical protein
MGLLRGPIRSLGDGRYEINLHESTLEVLAAFLEQFRELLMGTDDSLRRLFPVAYLNDPERDAEYQQMMHGELLESRFAAIETMEATLQADTVSESELTQWMQSINALRLVIGTRLDVSEEPVEIEPDDPDAMLYAMYELFGNLVDLIVRVLTPGLPPPSATGPGE